MSGIGISERRQSRATWRALWIGATLLVLAGIWWAESPAAVLAYMLVVAASLLPTVLWISRGRAGVPILPALATLSILYYAVPIVRGREDLMEYAYQDILRAAATISLYLATATLASFLFLRKVRAPEKQLLGLLSDLQLRKIVFYGLALGLLFLAGTHTGFGSSLGGFFGLARSLALTAMMVSCYFLGVARGRGVIRGRSWLLSVSLLALAVLISWSSLLLVGGLTFLLAAGVGYVTSRGRIPWLPLAIAVVLVSILHAGKEEMRDRHWDRGQGNGGRASLLNLPALALEWFGAGLEQIGESTEGRSVIDRASLLQILLKVQRMTPGYIDYMYGETYALIPGMLVPRFFDPGKTRSQAGMDALNIRYGILTAEGTERTAVGWGLTAEAYANFGYVGVVGIGLLIGFSCGALTRASARAAVVSFPTLMAVAVMVGLVNIELDLAGAVTSLLQSAAAVVVLVGVLRLLPRDRRARPSLRLAGLGVEQREESSLAAVGPSPK